ncbi:guanylate kinase-associated protein mars [Anastrepha obliqua]|uniref:guanylate kinase-associated protein mars n=1 Tax=Anastrepha obliqua TaxID=95512 RepID=UPI00240A0890|nr:guanylate kinase-associated protein mars [Anastrepha obliqua]
MNRYSILYKENSSMLSSVEHNRTNRELQNANRAEKRRQIFASGRNLNVSPTPKKSIESKEQKVHLENENLQKIENKENMGDVGNNTKCCEVKSADQSVCNKSRIALAVSGKVNPKKATRQEMYLLRFIEWKEAQKQKEKKREHKKPPFVPSGGISGSGFGSSKASVVSNKVKSKEVASFVPKDYHNFKPPAGLKNPLVKMTPAMKDVLGKDRQSFYTVVPTPPRDKKDNTTKVDIKKTPALNKTPAVSKLAGVTSVVMPAASAMKSTKTATTSRLANTNSTKAVKATAVPPSTGKVSTAVIEPSKKALSRALAYPLCAKTPASQKQKAISNVDIKLTSKEPLKKNPSANNKNGENAKQFKNRLDSALAFARPHPPKVTRTISRKQLTRPKGIGTSTAANIPKPRTTGGSTGAVGKAHLLQNKQTAVGATERSKAECNVKLATSLKAKKAQISTLNRPNAPNKIAIKSKATLGGARISAAFAIAETPTDLLNINPFEPNAASTRVKSPLPHTSKKPNISFVNSKTANDKNNVVSRQNIRAHSSSSAKRTLIQQQKKPDGTKQTSKFNFVRYSGGLSEFDMSSEIEEDGVNNEEIEKIMDDGKSTSQTEENTVLEAQLKDSVDQDNLTLLPESETNQELAQVKTPPSAETERPINYIGSFVAVSRGKVSARKEREKRDSVYIPSANENGTLPAAATTTPIKNAEAAPQTTIATPVSLESRRILEAVRYFRQQLSNEIERLHALCNQWEEYQNQNTLLLRQTGGDDMINVTVGQTKLLTSKKFQQFKGLIDRCECRARGTAAADDGSENTKPITDVDLEGFWSMLNLQVDNIEKRFSNLTRWKSNNWCDPDEMQQPKPVKSKSKPNLNKVKKAKPPAKMAKASSGLQAMLRNMHAKMRKNKETEVVGNGETAVAKVLTPTRLRQRRSHSGTPRNGDVGAEQRRISVVVRDRKSLSAAATIISLPANSSPAFAVGAQRRHSRINAESPKSVKTCSDELHRSLSNMEKAFSGCNDLLRSTLSGNALKSQRRSGTPNFIELPIEKEAAAKVQTPARTPPSVTTLNVGRKSILKTPGTTKGKPKNVIFNEKLRVKKFHFTCEDYDELSDDEKQRMQTSTEEPLADQRTYSLRTRKVVLRPSCEIEIPQA